MAAPTFRKQERIVSTRLIEMLFGKGDSQSLTAFPLRVVYLLTAHQDNCAPVQILISVPKKKFKHAVDRNRVKRQIREAYRHHKQILDGTVAEEKQLMIAFIWLSDRHCPSSVIEKKMVGILQRIAKDS
jgi:ribonuclease P protein component